jgi:dCMP deaminase
MKINWDEYFFNICEEVRKKSKDRSIKVGCVIAGQDNEIRSTGFNGFPRGVFDDDDKEFVLARHQRPEKYLWTEHAERNAIFSAARVGIPLKDCKIYVDWIPCADCARAIIQTGIQTVIVDGRNFENKWSFWKDRWVEHMICTIKMFKESNVKLNIWEGRMDNFSNSVQRIDFIEESLNVQKNKEEKK